MNRKKLLGIFSIISIVAILTSPLVSAKPTSAANNPKSVSFMWYSENGGGPPPENKINPPWAEEGSPDVKVSHGQRDWELNPIGNNYVQIGEDPPITIAPEDYEGHLYVVVTYFEPTDAALNYRVYEKIAWGDNYIEIMCLERASYDSSGFYASGIFSGHGIIDGQKVQVTGIREGFFDPMIGFVLECYGTIRGIDQAA